MSKKPQTKTVEVIQVVSPMAERILSVEDFCREAQMGRTTLYRMIEAGRIKITRDKTRARRVLIKGEEFLRYKASL